MYDYIIRNALISHIAEYDPTAVVYQELPLSRGSARADCAAVNGHLCGYEIKGGFDSLRRLENQIEHYDRIFEFSTVVTTDNHVRGVRRMIPSHWGIYLAREEEGTVRLRALRAAKQNRKLDASAVLKLLWKNEVVRIAKQHGVVFSDKLHLVGTIWADVLLQMSHQAVVEAVRESLKSRDR